MAPCAVHFDATPTTDSAYEREFHTLRYVWNFDDPEAGKWRFGPNWARDKNFDYGSIAGHVFETPGTYTVRLSVTNPTGVSNTTETAGAVVDPAAHFSPAATYCFANREGTFEGCPLDRNNDGECEIQASHCRVSGDFGASLLTHCQANSRQRWCAFRGGDTLSASTTVPLNRGSNGKPGLVSSFGSGGKAKINHDEGTHATINSSDYWTVSGLRIDNNDALGREGFRLGLSSNTLVHDTEIVSNGGKC